MALGFRLFGAVLALGFGVASEAGAESPPSVARDLYKDAKLHELDIHGDSALVETLVLKRGIPITYDYVATLMRTPNAFGKGPACVVCHSSSDPAKSYRGLDLSTCEGMLTGATEAPARAVVVPGHPQESLVAGMLHNNRMPLGVPFLHPIDTPAIEAIRDWIANGAKNDAAFSKSVLPLFTDAAAFGGGAACVECHATFRDPPSFNEVNLTSWDSIMTGAFSRTRGKEGKPGIPIVVPGKPESSRLYQRLTMNRMPPGIDPGDDATHPNLLLFGRWIEQGAKCK